MTIGNNSVVSMHYTLTDDSGNVLDSSEGKDPLTYLHGAGNIIPGLENAIAGKATGDQMNVQVAPADGYGEKHPELIQKIGHEAFQGVDEVQVGMAFNAQAPDGSTQRITVTAVEEDGVTVDGNHPLAGVTLNFDVDIVSVRDATEEEIEHGHAH